MEQYELSQDELEQVVSLLGRYVDLPLPDREVREALELLRALLTRYPIFLADPRGPQH